MVRVKSAEIDINDKRETGLVKRGLAMGIGMTAIAASFVFGTGAANADKCYVVGGMGDPTGEWAQGVMAGQGQLASCNEGVETVPYSASIWPLGPERMEDSVAPGVADLTNRLNNTPAWQHKRVLAFSEGTEVAAQAGNATNGTNVTIELNGGPQGRTGAFNSPLVTDIPLVKPIVDMIGIPTDTPLNQRPGVNYVRNYNQGDGYANLGAQGNDVFSAIPGAIGIADGMINHGTHQIPDPNIPHETFVDGDGIVNNVWDDGNPATISGSQNPAIMAPAAPAAPEFPAFVPDPANVPAPIPGQPLTPDQQAVLNAFTASLPALP